MGFLQTQGGALRFRSLPEGQRVHACCERDALAAQAKPITARPSEAGRYSE